MRVLRLSTSDETSSGVPAELRSAAICERMLAAASGEAVETITRTAWPEAGFPELLGGWIERYEPDIVLFVVPSVWVSFPTASLRLQRMRFPGAVLLGEAGASAGRHRTVVRNPIFRALRGAAMRTVGADYFFEPAAAAEVVGRALGRVLQREGVGLAVRGPEPLILRAPLAEQRRAAGRCRELNTRVEATCRLLHVPYAGQAEAMPEGEYRRQHQPDLLHVNAEGHATRGRIEGALLLEAWAAAAGRDPGSPGR